MLFYRVEVYDEEDATIRTVGVFDDQLEAELVANLEFQQLTVGDVAVIQHNLNERVGPNEEPQVIYSKCKEGN